MEGRRARLPPAAGLPARPPALALAASCSRFPARPMADWRGRWPCWPLTAGGTGRAGSIECPHPPGRPARRCAACTHVGTILSLHTAPVHFRLPGASPIASRTDAAGLLLGAPSDSLGQAAPADTHLCSRCRMSSPSVAQGRMAGSVLRRGWPSLLAGGCGWELGDCCSGAPKAAGLVGWWRLGGGEGRFSAASSGSGSWPACLGCCGVHSKDG